MNVGKIMSVRTPILAGLMGMTALGLCRAQKAVEFSSEAGVSGNFSGEVVYYGGLHGVLSKKNNCTDLYCGAIIDSDKRCTFESQLENEYSWNKHISSWIRETFHLSKQETALTSEIAPIKVNKSFKKFDAFVAPAYILANDFRDGETWQCLGIVLNTMYNINSKNSIKFEAEYITDPAKNIFKTKFGSFKDNTSYVVSYIRNF